jgi:hypothetical protein
MLPKYHKNELKKKSVLPAPFCPNSTILTLMNEETTLIKKITYPANVQETKQEKKQILN